MVNQITNYVQTYQDPSVPGLSADLGISLDLRFLIHFVGDLH